MTSTYINEKATYAIVDKETGIVVATFRLKAAATEGVLRYSQEHRRNLEIKKVK